MGNKAFFRLPLAYVSSVLTLGALLAGTAPLSTPAFAAEMQWIWSPSSTLVNQSTEALVEGRFAHAIRFANAALRSKLHPSDHVIARQNLCIATLAHNADKAAAVCEPVLKASTAYVIAERQGRLQVVEAAAGVTTVALDDTMRANIARAQGGNALAENR